VLGHGSAVSPPMAQGGRHSLSSFLGRGSMTDLSRNPISGQPLPHSLEAEQAVLGGLMLVNEMFDSVAAVLREEDFYGQDHQLIFRTMRRLATAEKPFDPITLSETLKE